MNKSEEFIKITNKYFPGDGRIKEAALLLTAPLSDFLNRLSNLDPGPFVINGFHDGEKTFFSHNISVGRLGIHTCTWRKFLTYPYGEEDFFYYIASSPYIKLVIDVDYFNGFKESESFEDDLTDFLKDLNIEDSFITTTREGGVNKHMIFSKHYDVGSFNYITAQIKKRFHQENYRHIDVVETWTFPGSRGHVLYDGNLVASFSDFKKSCPINVWDPIEVYTLLSRDGAGEYYGKLKGIDEIGLYAGKKVTKFANSFSGSSIAFHNIYFNVDELIDILHQQIRPVEYKKGLVDFNLSGCINLELYESYNYNRIKCGDLNEAFKNYDLQSIHLQKTFLENTIEPKFNYNEDCVDIIEDVLQNQKLAWTKGMIEVRNKPNTLNHTHTHIIIKGLKNYMQKLKCHDALMKLYKHYCSVHYEEEQVDEIEIYKRILEIAMNKYFVNSTLALILKCNIFKEHELLFSVLFLSQLDIGDTQRAMLFGHIDSANLSYKSTLITSLIKTFQWVDLLYALAELFTGGYEENLQKFLRIMNGSDFTAMVEDEPPKKKKKTQHKEPDKNAEIFEKFIMPHVEIGSEIFMFRDGMYTIFKEDPTTLLTKSRKYECEPGHGNYWYVRHGMVYYSINQAYERAGPSFFPSITIIRDESLLSYEEDILSANDPELISFIFTCYLKLDGFSQFLRKQEIATVLLCPVDDKVYSPMYNDVNIFPIDLNVLNGHGDLFTEQISEEGTPLIYKTFRHLHGIVCAINLSNRVDLENPHIFLTSTLLQGNIVDGNNEFIRGQHERLQYIDTTDNPTLSFFYHTLKNCMRIPETTKKTLRPLNDFEFTIDYEFKSLNIIRIDSYFNSIVGLGYHEYDPKAVDKDLAAFLFAILSWYIRFSQPHRLENTEFFKFIKNNREALYSELYEIVYKIAGKRLSAISIEDYAKIFQIYCENTSLEICQHFIDILPPQVTQLNNDLTNRFERYKKDIYIGLASFLIQGQFDIDQAVDLLKYFSGVTHKGNFRRQALLLLNAAKSGKTLFVTVVLEACFKSLERSILNKGILENSTNDRGNLLMRELNGNLIIAIDEVDELDKTFKLVVNTDTKMTNRSLYSAVSVEKVVNSNVVLMANDDPSVKDEATCTRLLPMSRTFRYVELNSNSFLQRTSSIENNETTTKFVGTQLLIQRLVKSSTSGDDSKLGYFLLIWNMVPIFYNNLSSPVSSKMSNKLYKNQDQYTLAVLPGKFLLDANLIQTSSYPIKLTEFQNQISTVFNHYKGNFVGGANSYSTFRYIVNMLGKQVNKKTDTICATVVMDDLKRKF